jgi:hypothetical protein
MGVSPVPVGRGKPVNKNMIVARGVLGLALPIGPLWIFLVANYSGHEVAVAQGRPDAGLRRLLGMPLAEEPDEGDQDQQAEHPPDRGLAACRLERLHGTLAIRTTGGRRSPRPWCITAPLSAHARACYALSASAATRRASKRRAKATKCRPRSVSANRS